MTKNSQRLSRLIATLILFALIGAGHPAAGEPVPRALLEQIEAYPHSRQVHAEVRQVIDYEIGLGAMQKVRGAWRFKDSERVSGELNRRTWQILDGFSSAELFVDLAAKLDAMPTAQLLFDCQGRACGHGSQWANRVFEQRVLYGRDDDQRYRVYRISSEPEAMWVVYASARTADRQYLHVDLLLKSSSEP